MSEGGVGSRATNVEGLDPLGYTDEEFYRAKCADLEATVKNLRETLQEISEGAYSLDEVRDMATGALS